MRGNCAEPIPTPRIRCAICEKDVDSVDVLPSYGVVGVRFLAWCHDDVDTCVIDEITLRDASEEEMSAGVAFSSKLLEEKMETEIYNPHERDENELPTIYGFANGGGIGGLTGILLAEDGTVLGGHVSSSEEFLKSDLGVKKGTRPDRHEHVFRHHYPGGYRMEYVAYRDVTTHPGLMRAHERNQNQGDQREVKEIEDGNKEQSG